MAVSTRNRWLSFAAVLVAAVLVGGCGGDSDSTTSATTGGASTQAEGNPDVAAAKAEIEAARKPLVFKEPGPAFDANKLKGKKILIAIIDARVPILSAVGHAVQEAAKPIGIKTVIRDAKSQFPRMGEAVQQAIDQKADALISLGLPAEALPEPFQKLKAAGIPSVTVTTHQPDANAPGQGGPNRTANSAPDFSKAAHLMADKAIIDTNGKANVAIIQTKEIGISKTIVAGMQDALQQCSGCKVSSVTSVALADWATKITPTAASIVRKDPNVNYILTIFDDMAIFATAGVNQAGAASRVKVAGFNGSPAALKLIQDGDVFAADAGQPSEWQGWHVLDQTMRTMLKQDPGDPVMPIRYFDDADLKGVDVKNEAALYGNPDFKDGFRKLWGLAG
jgi:ribose transport system substrate-binding protein